MNTTGPISPESGGSFAVDACCVDERSSICGVDLAAIAPTADTCQPLGQEGSPDKSCGAALGKAGRSYLAGSACCRPDGRCGVKVDAVAVDGTSLGCVAAEVILGLDGPLFCTP